ncbi:MAG: M48 family metallopeptidase [Clostridiales bacterium]|jgi:heat shock protein HtpX|nr:M48 family metallopeptidase [Clostridiales bacterium]
MFEAVQKNKRRTYFIATLCFVFLGVVVYFIAEFSGLGNIAIPIAVLVAICSTFFSYFFSDKIVLASSHAKPADEETEKYLHNIVEGLCVASGLPKPRIYVVDDPAPNAFATGRNPQKAVVCVTTGLLQRLDYYQLEGVLAHELAHIKNYDILLSTVVTVMVGIVIILSDIFTRFMFFGGGRSRRSNDDNGGGIQIILFIIGLIFIILAPLFGQLLKMALSRNREYLADSTAIEFTRNPEGLATALEKISQDPMPVEHANKATANMYICNPLRNKKGESVDLFSTHPPIDKRIEAIRNIR